MGNLQLGDDDNSLRSPRQGYKLVERMFGFVHLFLKLFEFGSGSFIIEGVCSNLTRLFFKVFIFSSCSVYLN